MKPEVLAHGLLTSNCRFMTDNVRRYWTGGFKVSAKVGSHACTQRVSLYSPKSLGD